MTSRRTFLQSLAAAGLVLGAGGVVAACGSDGDSTSSGSTGSTGGSTPTMRLAMTEPFPLYLAFIADLAAKSGGFLAERGLDLDLQFAQGAPQALQQLVAGNVALVRNAPIAQARAVTKEGAPLVSIGVVNQELLYILVSSQKKPVDGLDGIAGATVGMATLGGNAEDTWNGLLKAKGIDPASVKLQAVGNEAAAMALVDEGRIDLMFSTREAAGAMRQQGLDPHVAEVPGANPLLGTNLVTTKEAIAAHRPELVAFLGGLHASMEALRDPATRIDLLRKVRGDWELPQLDDPEQASPIIQAISDMWYAAGEQNLLRNVPERWAQGVAGFEKSQIVPAGTDPTTLYTNDLLDEALGSR